MSWELKRPVTGKLPSNSGNWQGNETVEMLTGYWDDFLVGVKDKLDTGWFISDTAPDAYLDYIGVGLCGYGKAWLSEFSPEIKRRLINNFPTVLKSRGSKQSVDVLIRCIVPEAELVHYQIPRADFSYADLTVVSDYPVTRYMICLPNHLGRDGKEFRWMRHLIRTFMPIADISLQYAINLPDQTLAGDWSVN